MKRRGGGRGCWESPLQVASTGYIMKGFERLYMDKSLLGLCFVSVSFHVTLCMPQKPFYIKRKTLQNQKTNPLKHIPRHLWEGKCHRAWIVMTSLPLLDKYILITFVLDFMLICAHIHSMVLLTIAMTATYWEYQEWGRPLSNILGKYWNNFLIG